MGCNDSLVGREKGIMRLLQCRAEVGAGRAL
jgi:hypothetical protein